MSTIGILHTAFALIALATGLAIFTIAKGTRLHRVIGYVYVISMLGLNLTALTIYRLFGGFGPFHALAIASLVTLAAGFIPVFTRRPKGTWLHRHYEWILWSYVGLVAAACSELITRLPVFDSSGPVFGAAVFVASTLVVLGGAAIIYRKREAAISRMLAMLRARAS
jgi:uncharacterized membrane protein